MANEIAAYAIEGARIAYVHLVEDLEKNLPESLIGTERRKAARQAAEVAEANFQAVTNTAVKATQAATKTKRAA